jgi:hypothetical protein
MQFKYTVTIVEAENGFMVRHDSIETEEDGKTSVRSEQHVFENDEYTALEKMLIYLAEWYGESYDKFGSNNVRISWDRKGHKAE